MFVRSIMKPSYKCIVSSSNQQIGDVLSKLDKYEIQATPIVDDQTFMGMISRQIIYRAFFHSELDKGAFLEQKLSDTLLTNQDLYIDEDEVFEKTLPIFKDFPILAVANKDKNFLGIISRFDVLEQFESAFGAKKKGLRIAFTSEESEGRVARLADIIDQLHANIISITSFDETDKLARRIVIKINHVDHPNMQKIKRKFEKSGFRILDIKEI
ncbi:CBS domain-containing protein [Aquibacillus sediminis]|uniref:CBS domain-containing protein n=1 Tax=Aquibacillus sediminis TaxID=2574734 RepID=UPI001107BE9F|nr:CBS domain-containing protein [Aquibacillus sediminis]